jgi:ribonuclease HII
METFFTAKSSRCSPKSSIFERTAWAENSLICGIDEVGRGCLAGPVVVAAVILRKNALHSLLRDSKILTKKEREEAFKWIVQNSWFSYSSCDHEIISRINIYRATQLAMVRVCNQLFAACNKTVSHILIDAMPLSLSSFYGNIKISHFPQGESRSISIAAASIVAKVIRDKLMEKVDLIIPGYSLAKHKGYATPEHKQSIVEKGHSIIHRETFLHYQDGDAELQLELF